MIGQRYINKIYVHHHTLIKTTNKQKKEESDAFLLLSGGGWTRTNDLQVMSLASYHCSTPRCFLSAKLGTFIDITKYQIVIFLKQC